jgi:hypothetical protein
MAAIIKMDPSGTCNLCKKISLPNEHVECFICKFSFHAVCPNASNDDKLAAKTSITSFLNIQKKSNFKFFCDICATNMEKSIGDTTAQRVNVLETQLGDVNSQLKEIKDLLAAKDPVTPASPSINNSTENIWFNKDKLKTMKASLPSALVLEKGENENTHKEHVQLVEKAIMENEINLKETYKDKKGGLGIVCGDQEARDKLRDIVSNSGANVPTKTPSAKTQTISIVGLHKESNPEEVVDMLVKQNEFVRRFTAVNNINDHFKVLAIRPTKNNQNVFQVFAAVSGILRDGIKQFRDKVTLGLTSCKVYDRYNVKRCNRCQHYGHYSRDCTSDSEHCAKCAGAHATETCTATIKKCINCVRTGVASQGHHAFDSTCPTMIARQEVIKSKVDKTNLNALRRWNAQTP